jgi:hypothetical protein
MGVASNGGFDALMGRLAAGGLPAAYVVGEDLLACNGDAGASF